VVGRSRVVRPIGRLCADTGWSTGPQPEGQVQRPADGERDKSDVGGPANQSITGGSSSEGALPGDFLKNMLEA